MFVDIEGGVLTLREKFPNIEVVRVSTWRQIQEVYDALRKGEGGYKTVVLDSLTEIQKFSMYTIMQELLVKGRPSGEAVDPDVPSMREWGKNIEQTRRLVRAFRDLPMNAIFTALATSEKDSKTGVMHTKPYLSGKLSGEVAGFLDIVLYYYIKAIEGKPSRLLLSTGTEQQIAKDRSDRLPLVILQPTMQDIYNYIFNPVTPTATEPEQEN